MHISILDTKLSEYNVILGSSSARRQEILRQNLKLTKFKVFVPSFEENLSKSLTPKDYVEQTARGKLESILTEGQFDKPAIVICCDTIIQHNNKILEKPETFERQRQMFEGYRANPKIEVISAIAVAKVQPSGTSEYQYSTVSSNLMFDTSIAKDITDDYILSKEGLDAAGGFKYQELGYILFSELQGDYLNVVGLPARNVFDILWNIS